MASGSVYGCLLRVFVRSAVCAFRVYQVAPCVLRTYVQRDVRTSFYSSCRVGIPVFDGGLQAVQRSSLIIKVTPRPNVVP